MSATRLKIVTDKVGDGKKVRKREHEKAETKATREAMRTKWFAPSGCLNEMAIKSIQETGGDFEATVRVFYGALSMIYDHLDSCHICRRESHLDK